MNENNNFEQGKFQPSESGKGMSRREFLYPRPSAIEKKKDEQQAKQELAKTRDDIERRTKKSRQAQDQTHNPSWLSRANQDKQAHPSRREFLKKAGIAAGLTIIATESFDPVSQWFRKKFNYEYPDDPTAEAIELLKRRFSHIDQWADPEEWSRAIEFAFVEARLDQTPENLAMAMAIITGESGFRTSSRIAESIPSPAEHMIEELGDNSTTTGGPMEILYAQVAKTRGISIEEARKHVNSIEGGVKEGVAYLKTIIDMYAHVSDEQRRVMCIFADWNAGPYASRSAGVQEALAEITGKEMDRDGLLGKKSRALIKELFDTYAGPNSPTNDELEADMKKAYQAGFPKTRTWKLLEQLHQGKPIEPIPAKRGVKGAYADVLATLGMPTNSLDYAQRRYAEYQAIKEIASTIQEDR